MFSYDPFPLAAAEEAVVVDEAFKILMVQSVPVFSFVLAALGYSVFRFRRKGEPGDPIEDGPPIHSHRGVLSTWFAITTALTVLVIIFPGITGLLDLRERASEPPDQIVQLRGVRWAWLATYPEYGVTLRSGESLVLPVDDLIKFEITSMDVLHAFWIPAFRMKIDAVPGLITTITATPNSTGTFESNYNLRLQCAELCGGDHAGMVLPIQVVERDEFEAWIADRT